MALVLMLTSISTVSANKLVDIDGLTNENEITFLYNLGIIEGNENGEFMAEASVKRIEFAVMILRMLNMDGFAMEGEFSDIPETHWAYESAGTVKAMGIVDGIEDDVFGIDMDVTYEQALKMLVSALGYKDIAEEMGGYPEGYNAMAINLGITEDVPMTKGALNRLQAALLIENCLTADMLRSGKTDTSDSDTILNDILKFTEYRGKVEATYDAQGTENLAPGQVIINGKRYKLNLEECIIDEAELFGREIKFYVKEKDGEELIYHTEVVGQPYESIYVEADDINATTTTTKLVYRDGSKVKEEAITDPATVYYNGRIIASSYITNSRFRPSEGSIRISDMDDNGTFETVQIVNYETAIVSRVTDEKIYDKYGKHIALEDFEQVEIYKDGDQITADALKEGDVLSICKDVEGIAADIIVCNDYVDGKITRKKSNSYGSDLYTVEMAEGTRDLALSSALRTAISENYMDVSNIGIGTEGRFYLTSNGKIAAFEKITVNEDGDSEIAESELRKNDMLYGYLWSSQLAYDGEDMLVLKVLTEANKYENIIVNAEAKFGRRTGGTYSFKNETAGKMYEIVGGTKQLIAYKLGDDGYVESLCLADTQNNDDYLCQSLSQRKFGSYSNRMFDTYYYVDMNTVVFSLPNYATSESYNSVGKYNDFFSSGEYTVSFYDVSDDGHIGAIVYMDQKITTYSRTTGGYETYIDPANSSILYIEEVVTELVDGEEKTILKGWENGKQVSRILADTLNENSHDRSLIRDGSVIQYEMNSIPKQRAINSEIEDQIVVFRHIINMTDDTDYKTTYGYQDDLMTIISGKANISTRTLVVSVAEVTAITSSIIRIKSDISISMLKQVGTTVLSFNKDTCKYTKRTIDDLETGMDVFVRQRKNNAIEIIYFE